MPRGGHRRSNDPDAAAGEQSLATYANAQVPYRDAEPGDGEQPLDSIDVFRIPARDNTGASDHCTFYGPPLMMRFMDIIIHSHRFPYLNRGDFLRHAIARHVAWLVSIRGSLPRHLSSGIESMAEVCRDDETQIQMQAVLSRIKERVDLYIRTGEIAEAVQLINRLRHILESVIDSHWTRTFKHAFYTQYGSYLRVPKAMNGEGSGD